MAELHETRMGKTLIDSTFPKIAKELKRIADALESIDESRYRKYINKVAESMEKKDNLISYLKMTSLCASKGLEQDKDFEQIGDEWRRI